MKRTTKSRVSAKNITFLDSTLRDGAQAEGISFTLQDKLNIVRALDAFGIDYIEAGNPGSNPKDLEFFQEAQSLSLKNAQLCAFGATRRPGESVESDAGVQALLAANTPAVAIVGKASSKQVRHILRTTLDENLSMLADTLECMRSHGKNIIFDAEHFFDGFLENPEYALEVLKTAYESGASIITLCDTNGGRTPTEIMLITYRVVQELPNVTIGIHTHNDCGCAVANAMLAVESGARHVQGTLSGFGERCGNADLSVLIPNLILKKGYKCRIERMDHLFNLAHRIADIANISIPNEKPYVGRSAFAHKGGMHVDGMLKLKGAFEHIQPSAVGNHRRYLLSEVAGRSAIIEKIHHIAPELTKDSPETTMIIERLKQMELNGYQFESAEASFELLVKKCLGLHKPHFELVLYKTIGEYPAPNGREQASAMIEVKVGDNVEITAALGNGPVHALDNALRKALRVFYPQLDQVHLIDYKVRILDAESATAATTRVLIVSSDGHDTWTTVGVSSDIIEASWIALVDSIEYQLGK